MTGCRVKICERLSLVLEQINGELPDNSDYQLVQFNMAESDLLRDRYNLRTVPMLLYFMNGKLVAITNTTLVSATTTQDSFLSLFQQQLISARAGVTLPTDYRCSIADHIN